MGVQKSSIAIIILASAIAAGYIFLVGTSRQEPPASLPSGQEPFPPSGEEPGEVSESNAVNYTDAGYTPATLRIKTGEAVTFQNNSPRAMWTASSLHPTHRVYPTTGGCLGSTFDACRGVGPGDRWSFRFDIPGTWKYHNHLSPGDAGTIMVE